MPIIQCRPENFEYPKTLQGEGLRSFRAEWLNKFSWLHYRIEDDSALCHICRVAYFEKKLHTAKYLEKSFITTGMRNWKKGISKFYQHQASECHKIAMQNVVTLPSSCKDVGESLNEDHSKEKEQNRTMLMKILQNLVVIGRMGLPLRGHLESEGVFMELLNLRALDDESITAWLAKKRNKYVSKDIQNELLQLMAASVLRKIAFEIRSSIFFSIMADEVTDASNTEQLTVCLRWVDSNLDVHEDFLGFYAIESIRANDIVASIKDVLLRMNLSISNCRGQCYDGASSMAGSSQGVAVQIKSSEFRAHFIHCYGHALNLAVKDATTNSNLLRDMLDTAKEISKLVKYSPKRESLFKKIKEELHEPENDIGIREFSTTRWTVRAGLLKSIVSNYAVLQDLWEQSLSGSLESDMRARIIGVQAQMQTFPFFYSLMLGELIFRHTDNLSSTLQNIRMTSVDGQDLMKKTVTTMESIRTDYAADSFFDLVTMRQEHLHIEDAVLPRKRRRPKRYEEGSSGTYFHHNDVKSYYRQLYFEGIDHAINAIKKRFNQPGFQAYLNLETILLGHLRGNDIENNIACAKTIYDGDIDFISLEPQLNVFRVMMLEWAAVRHLKPQDYSFQDVITFLKETNSTNLLLIEQIVVIARLLLVSPATNASSERSFSALLRRLKTWLRARMTSTRLNSVALLNIHKERTANLDLKEVANDFIKLSKERFNFWGKF